MLLIEESREIVIVQKCMTVSNIHKPLNQSKILLFSLYIRLRWLKIYIEVFRQMGVRRRETMRLWDRRDKHSLIGSLEAVNSGVALLQWQNWFSCQRVNYPAAIYSFGASPGRIPSPCHSCQFTDCTHILIIAVDEEEEEDGYIWLFLPVLPLHTQNWFYPKMPRSACDLLTPERTQSFPSEVTVNQHNFLKGWN